jgi:hypothetical protein
LRRWGEIKRGFGINPTWGEITVYLYSNQAY